ncbi:NADP-dependent phosphogluconate dehydrogenase [Aquimarina sp. AU474]|uniref:NADP-dependent phosphogluconate dehydrogenase n=1 Tax=Aquimarina sp. AU474 TaxID=2108529 RepID=UPI000D697175|nr:NADP-dependent phosphogluconate dehydrogenase [Aquimarina sp. AU474]
MILKPVYIVFGVSGSGKTTIGNVLAKELDIPFFDADDFHPQSNIQKMSDGYSLDDNDRTPWLSILTDQIKNWHQDKGAVLACSALKIKYREKLESFNSDLIHWIFLDGDYDLILSRLKERKGHFFQSELLTSQFDVLEKPTKGISIKVNQSTTHMVTEIKSKLNVQKSQIGLFGLGVMGKSLAKNILSNNFSLSVYNRHIKEKEVDVAKNFADELTVKPKPFDDLQLFVESLQQPRIIMLMISAGPVIDQVVKDLLPFLNTGDCILDGGNSHYKDTIRREKLLSIEGISFLGVGISGGEEGALKGPSIMPGGTRKGYEQCSNFLEAIAAKDKGNKACCSYIGSEGSGHFVKMIHNGIEYGEMQLLAEIYHLLRHYLEKKPSEIEKIFTSWRTRNKDSYLLEITTDILLKKEGSGYLIDKILDKADQKGTGSWSSISALKTGVPFSTISEAVMVRFLSAKKDERIKASNIYNYEISISSENKAFLLKQLEEAYYAASIINHAIGFDSLKQTSLEYDWNLNLSEIARIWTNGCIIRSDLMEKMAVLLSNDNDTSVLLFPEIVDTMNSHISKLTFVVSNGLQIGCALPVLSAASNYFLNYTSAQMSANMIQAQRDYFGAHKYQRIDKKEGEYFHTDWKN